MADRGLNPFVKAFIYFVRSLKPSSQRGALVGSDHLGNKYYEIKAEPSKGKRTPTRFFKPQHADDWDIPLPPEWNAWLRLQRDEPPTFEETINNLKRFENLQKSKTENESSHKAGAFPTFTEYEKTPGSLNNK